jgi:alpha-tubulin suppressor-like RCC1 family protein
MLASVELECACTRLQASRVVDIAFASTTLKCVCEQDGANRFVPETPAPFDGENMRASNIAGGGHHSVVIDDCGQVWTCGKGSYGQLGHGCTASVAELTLVEALRGNRMLKVVVCVCVCVCVCLHVPCG